MNNTSTKTRILNTRPKGQNQSLSQLIVDAGGIAVECPTIHIEPKKHWIKQLPELEAIHQAIFISANAVHHFFAQASSSNRLWQNQIKIHAIGQATYQAIHSYGLPVNNISQTSDSEGLLSHPLLQSVDKQLILLIKGTAGRQLIEKKLLARGANIVEIGVYSRSLPNYSQKKLNRLWQEDEVDIILFTSQTSVIHFYQMMQPNGWKWVQYKTCLAISQRIADKAQELGIQQVLVASLQKLPGTIQSLCRSK